MTRWFNNIKKAPPPYYHVSGNKYHWLQMDDIPGLKGLFSKDKFPLHNQVWRKAQPRVHFEEHNFYTPRIGNRESAILLTTILDLETKQPKYNWRTGRLKGTGAREGKWETSPEMNSLAAGDENLALEPDEVGVVIIYQNASKVKSLFEINIYVPKDNDFEQFVNKVITAGTGPKDYELTNGEAAALLIVSQMANKKEDLKQRKRLFDDFKVGPLVKDTDSKYILSLVDKGFMEMNPNHTTRNLRNYPLSTPKGNAASNRFEMTFTKFMGAFKKEVLANPDEPFTMWESTDPSGSDSFASEWV